MQPRHPPRDQRRRKPQPLAPAGAAVQSDGTAGGMDERCEAVEDADVGVLGQRCGAAAKVLDAAHADASRDEWRGVVVGSSQAQDHGDAEMMEQVSVEVRGESTSAVNFMVTEAAMDRRVRGITDAKDARNDFRY